MPVGFLNEDDFRRNSRNLIAQERSPRNIVKSTVRQPVNTGDGGGAGCDGVAKTDWTAFQVIEVQVHNEDGYTGKTVMARAIGAAGLEGTRCYLGRIKGYAAFKYQLFPIECTPTGTVEEDD